MTISQNGSRGTLSDRDEAVASPHAPRSHGFFSGLIMELMTVTGV